MLQSGEWLMGSTKMLSPGIGSSAAIITGAFSDGITPVKDECRVQFLMCVQFIPILEILLLGRTACPEPGDIPRVGSFSSSEKRADSCRCDICPLLATSSDGLQPNSGGFHLVASCY